MSGEQFVAYLDELNPSFRQEVYHFIEFLLEKQSKELNEISPKFGCAKGQFIMSDDFDEPLEEMKEYMY